MDANQLFEQASRLQQQQQLTQALSLYQKIIATHPEHAPSLNRVGSIALGQGKLEHALALLNRAVAAEPTESTYHFNLGRAYFQTQRLDHAATCFQRTLDIAPGFAMAHLFFGACVHKLQNTAVALDSYQRAMTLNPQLSQAGQSNPQLQEVVQTANRALRQKYMALHKETFVSLQNDHGAQALKRVERCLDIQHGKKIPFNDELQRPSLVFFPDLEPQAWFEREDLSWTQILEQGYQQIKDEIMMLVESSSNFQPYVEAGPHVPDSMQHLAGSRDWHSLHLYAQGKKQIENCIKCPVTTHIVETLPLPYITDNAPEVFFSLLKPTTHIKPHFGVANIKVAFHLPLLVPDHCQIRVGRETRSWEAGKCLIFDDSFEHEAWNKSAETRIVLIGEVWHPHLTEVETHALTQLSNAIEHWSDSF